MHGPSERDNVRIAFIGGLAVLLTACGGGQSQTANEITSDSSPIKTSLGDRKPLQRIAADQPTGQFGGVRSGMPYAEARRLLLAAGFRVVRDTTPTVEHVMAERKKFPEVGQCSADGYCGMSFIKDGRQASVITYGEEKIVREVGWDGGGRPAPKSIEIKKFKLSPLSDSLLNADQNAIYGYACQARDENHRLVLFTTDPTAKNQIVDGAVILGEKLRHLQGDRNFREDNTLHLRDSTNSLILDVSGMSAEGDSGDSASGFGHITIDGDSRSSTFVTVTCVVT